MGLFSKEEPKRVVVRTGKELTCLGCGFELFFERQGQLHTKGASFFHFAWASLTADCCVCGRCGFIHWFLGA
ncbi:MAG TPA: hypothetical protein VK843_04375 [Planctomycetota bacterium]|nr:hypothetical protein [Planctomycetota bacterium]